MTTTTLSSKGQIVIPKQIRKDLGLKPGTDFELQKGEDGTLVLVPLQEQIADDLYGVCSDTDFITELEEEHEREKNRENRLEK